MIKNERQYKITKKQFTNFSKTIEDFEESNKNSKVHPLLIKAQLSALEYQAEVLENELVEYEHLKSGDYAILEVASFQDLPKALIRARISLNLTQKDLAERLGWQEQIIQRYEKEDYSSVSFERMYSIINALDLKIRENIFLPNASRDKNMLQDKLSDIGLSSSFIDKRILGIKRFNITADEWIEEVVSKVTAIFNWEKDFLLGDQPLVIGKNPAMIARFKMPAIVNTSYMTAYTVYTHFISSSILKCKKEIDIKYHLDDSSENVREILLKDYKEINFQNILNYIWKTNTAVVSMNDSAGFHGATWRIKGQNIIVIKQKTKFESKYMFDLLHELFHATQSPEESEFSIIEADETSEERRFSSEEIAANEFASNVLLGMNSKEIVSKCFKYAKGKPAWLKSSVQRVSEEENVDLGVLAYQVAFEADKKNFTNWWGTATNLQVKNTNLVKIAQDYLIENIDLSILNTKDQELVQSILV